MSYFIKDVFSVYVYILHIIIMYSYLLDMIYNFHSH